MRAITRYLPSVLLALVLVWGFWHWFLRDLDWARVRAAWTGVSLAGLGLAVLLNLSQNAPRVWRWQELLRPVRRGIPFNPMFSTVMIGYMTTFVVPGRLGELVRPALLSSMQKVPLGPSLGSVVADRLLDGLTIVALFALAVFVEPLSGSAADSASTVRAVALGLVLVTVAGLSVLLLLSRYRLAFGAWLERRPALIGRVGRTALSFARGMEALRSGRGVTMIAAHSLACWLLISLGTWVGLRACGAELTFWGVLVLMPVLALGVAIPTPGNVGGYQVVMAVALQGWFGVDEAIAVTTGILMWLVIVIPYILGGLMLMIHERLSLRHLMELGRQVRELGGREPGEVRP